MNQKTLLQNYERVDATQLYFQLKEAEVFATQCGKLFLLFCDFGLHHVDELKQIASLYTARISELNTKILPFMGEPFCYMKIYPYRLGNDHFRIMADKRIYG